MWVKIGDEGKATKVEVDDGYDVDDLKDVIKKRFSPKLDNVSLDDLVIHESDGSLRESMKVTEIKEGNDTETALVVKSSKILIMLELNLKYMYIHCSSNDDAPRW